MVERIASKDLGLELFLYKLYFVGPLRIWAFCGK